ncbi:reverse transcriptase domain-containing protein [Tanacetum coccineum]
MENSLNSSAENSPVRFHPERSRTRGRSVWTDLRESSHSRGHSHRGHSHIRKRSQMEDRSRSTKESYGDTYSQGTTTKALEVKDKRRDQEDHLKIFQAAAQVERWAIPTWCHMFNSTLIEAARVWFDELPPESIDGYKGLKAAFLAYFMQQKKYVKDPVEIHNIKQRDRETIEDFIERFKVETGRMKGALECMRISGFMHGVNNPKLTKRLNEHVPKTMEEMMTITTASKKKGHSSWKSQDHSKRHAKI